MAFKDEVTQVGANHFVLPPVGDMKTQVDAFLSPNLFAQTDEALWRQAAGSASYPGAIGMYLMPDTHLGYSIPVGGVLAPLDIPLQEGQWVQSGQQLSRVVVPGRLKAEIRITQTQAQDIVIGQNALIDTRTDTIMGQVTRIDPAVRNGTVTIDVTLPNDLPPSARPEPE